MGAAQRFRPDIQGLRAVAVLAVALDHAGVWPFRSGFVGVDVFFVVSGFLITQLLLVEAHRTGRISLAGFYARRARRILPAATLVLVVVVLAAALLLSRVDAVTVAQDAVWASLFGANITYGRQGTDYFAADLPPSPLTHYWSLSIEEQYYLAWPALLAVVVLLAVRAGRGRVRNPLTVGVTAVLLVAIASSFAASVTLTAQDPVGAYFSTWARIWELGVGGLAALAVPLALRLPTAVRAGGSWLGLAAIGWSTVFVDETRFPGWVVAVPVLGTALLLLGGLGARERVPQRLLCLRPMRAVGDCSYSFYLWHWPALVFTARLWHEPRGLVGLAVLAAALALSAFTYRYVERPFRQPSSARPRVGGVLLYPVAIGLSLAVAVGAGAFVRSGTPDGAAITLQHYGRTPGAPAPHFDRDPVRALVQASALAARNGVGVPGDLRPDIFTLKDDVPGVGECDYHVWPRAQLCRRGDVHADRVIVLVGDSHARAWIPAVEAIGREDGYATYYLVKQGCTQADLVPYSLEREDVQDGCVAFRQWAFDQIGSLHPALTILTGDAPDAVQRPDGSLAVTDREIAAEMAQGTAESVDELKGRTDRVVVLGDVPGLREQPGLCLSARSASLAGCAGDPRGRGEVMNRATRGAATREGGAFVDPTPWFCAHDVCPAVVGRTLVYRDLEHISATYAGELAGSLAAALELTGSG
jgi:peptidoglycan/LPS O-acetylase OafA/YrhL